MHDIYKCIPQNALKVSFVILPLHTVVVYDMLWPFLGHHQVDNR